MSMAMALLSQRTAESIINLHMHTNIAQNSGCGRIKPLQQALQLHFPGVGG